MIYLDSSALLKLLFEETESASLEAWLAERAELAAISSELVKAEVPRAARRLNASSVPEARMLVSQVDLIPLRGAVVEATAEVGDATLRTLDAIHLASALSVRAELTDFVAYDHRLLAAARAARLPAISPGAAAAG